MVSTSRNTDPVRQYLHGPYVEAGFRTTPYQIAFPGPTVHLQPLTGAAKTEYYARYIHHKGMPVFDLKYTDLATIRRAQADYDRYYVYYQDVHSGDLKISSQGPTMVYNPSRLSKEQIKVKIASKHETLLAGVPRDIADIVHGLPFSKTPVRNWLGAPSKPSWSKVEKSAPVVNVVQEANSIAPSQVLQSLRSSLERFGMVRLTNTLTGVKYALRLDKTGSVEYKILQAVH